MIKTWECDWKCMENNADKNLNWVNKDETVSKK